MLSQKHLLRIQNLKKHIILYLCTFKHLGIKKKAFIKGILKTKKMKKKSLYEKQTKTDDVRKAFEYLSLKKGHRLEPFVCFRVKEISLISPLSQRSAKEGKFNRGSTDEHVMAKVKNAFEETLNSVSFYNECLALLHLFFFATFWMAFFRKKIFYQKKILVIKFMTDLIKK